MGEASQSAPISRNRTSNLHASRVAGAQWGVIGWRQLQACGVTRPTASRWRAEGKLHFLHLGVCALGHPSIPPEGQLVAALLYAGSDAALSHATAAWWWGLSPEEPPVIELSCLRRVRPSNGVVVHQRRHFEITRHRRFAITTVPQTLLDFAAKAPLIDVRRALAQADYERILDPAAVAAIAGQGKPGSKRLRQGLRRHQPRLAQSRSGLETIFFLVCEQTGLPLPELNARVAGWTVDALWRRERVVVEVDGHDNHRSPAQIERDRRKELELRLAGFLVLRYTWRQVTQERELVVADLLARLAERMAHAA